MGYGSFFTPFIPMFIAGEEFDNPYKLISNCTGSWLLASEVKWDELNSLENASFFRDMQKAIRLRKSEFSLDYFSPRGSDPNVVVIEGFSSSLNDTPAPYLRFNPFGGDAILVVGNSDPNFSAAVRMSIPLNQTRVEDTNIYRVKDLWSGKTAHISKQQLDDFEVMVAPDNFRILKISSWDPSSVTNRMRRPFFML